jgi:N-acetyl-gamma-glutamylphosphate reductase
LANASCANKSIYAIGYVGGAALDHVYRAHPDYEYTLLVRDEQRGQPIKAQYPTAKFVYGTLENSDVVRDAAAAADIVIRTCTPFM